jgi:hypothetical protein
MPMKEERNQKNGTEAKELKRSCCVVVKLAAAPQHTKKVGFLIN